jgi:signal transduction histidine kinase
MQRRLTRNLVAVVLLVSAISGILVYSLARRALTSQFDSALAAQARSLAMLLKEEGPGRYEFDFSDEIMPEFELKREPAYFQIWDASGRVIEKSRSLDREGLERSVPGHAGHPEIADIRLPDGRRGRTAALLFLPHPDDEHVADDRPSPADSAAALVVVARGRDTLDRVLHMVVATIAAGVGAASLLAFVLVPWGVRRGLKPVRQLADQVAGIDAENIGAPLVSDPSPSELAPVYDRLNDLLARIGESFTRERRFSSDVSHELRTPIAEAKTALEMVRRWPGDAEVVGQQSAAAAAAVDQMERIVGALLNLTRSGALAVSETQMMNVSEAAERIVLSLSDVASGRCVSVSTDAEPLSTVYTAPALLESVLRNLIENAVVHSPEGAAVRVTVRHDAGAVAFETENSAPDLEHNDMPRLFDAFWCKDESRTSYERLGLGLSLVRLLCRQIGATVTTTLSSERMLLVRVTIPNGARG